MVVIVCALACIALLNNCRPSNHAFSACALRRSNVELRRRNTVLLCARPWGRKAEAHVLALLHVNSRFNKAHE